MASSIYKFQKQTPPRFRTKPLKEQNMGPDAITDKDRVQTRITCPRTPNLSTKERKRPLPVDCLSREQQEEKEAEEIKKYVYEHEYPTTTWYCMDFELLQTQKSVLNMASSDSQIDKPQRGRPKRAELPDVNINTCTHAHTHTRKESFFNMGLFNFATS